MIECFVFVLQVYESLAADPIIHDVVPRYYREVEYRDERFIELQDLLHGFQDPHVMDVKMGTRTFLESEVQKTTARHDLYLKVNIYFSNIYTYILFLQ